MLVTLGCSSPTPSGSKEVSFASGQRTEGKITEAELQDSLFRFANRFSTDINEGMKGLEQSPDANVHNQALLRRLIYNAAVLDVALGPSPAANLLDMVAFVELSRIVWNDYWQPKVFKEQGAPVTKAFQASSDEIWGIAKEVMNKDQISDLSKLIRRWREKNPDQTSVENIRFSEFSKEAGASAQAMQKDVGGLMASIQGATQVGDRALLFSERALFYAQRAPFLLRLQARAGTREALAEAMSTLSSTQSLVDQEPKIRALTDDISRTFASLAQSLAAASVHSDTLSLGSKALVDMASVLREWNRTLQSPKYGETLERLTNLSGVIDSRTNRLLWKVFALGASLILLFGLVSLGSRLAYHSLARRMRSNKRKAKSPPREAPKAA